jgi:hypothetical protein
MIDWYGFAANSLWIMALALALAILSFARWEATRQRKKLGQILMERGWQVGLAVAGILFCGGLAATADSAWKTILWLGWLVIFSAQLFMTIFAKGIRR